MARSGFSQEELDALNNNKYVIYAENNRIVYSNEFKLNLSQANLPRKFFLLQALIPMLWAPSG